MSRRSSSKATILLVTMLAVGVPSACGGSASTTGTSPPTSGSAASSSHASSGGSPTSPISPSGKDAIPALAGDEVSVAELYLRQVGLRAGQMLPESSTRFQPGLVITTSPYAGDEVPSGSAVDLLVSDGYPGCQPGMTCSAAPSGGASATMPDVIGQTVAQATTTLALDGITLGCPSWGHRRRRRERSSAPSRLPGRLPANDASGCRRLLRRSRLACGEPLRCADRPGVADRRAVLVLVASAAVAVLVGPRSAVPARCHFRWLRPSYRLDK